MAVVQSLGGLTDLEAGWLPGATYGSLQLYDQYWYDYATLFRTQPNVRTCVEFLARNIAQLGLHVFRRQGETDRVRLRDHPLALTLEEPLPPEFKMTRYRLIESLVADLGIYFNAYWVKIRAGDRWRLLRIPPSLVSVYGGLYPQGYEIALGTKTYKMGPREIFHSRGYNPESCTFGLAPLETLRRVLAEEYAMGEYREYFWRNSARMNGIIERPKDAPDWSEAARARFKAEFEELYAGGENSGKTAILEEGMTWKESAFNAQESEYLGGRKLTREECARAYHIPLPMVGILDNATFSNIREQHKNLYQDCLGPWLAMIEQDIELQLLPDMGDADGVYCEFNIQEKLQGSFEEQTQSLQAAVGRPWMAADEARARMNLPSMGGDAGQLVTPLNVLVGGQASPRDSAPPKAMAAGLGRRQGAVGTKARGLDPTLPDLRKRHVQKWVEVLEGYFRRQEKAILARAPKKASRIDDLWTDQERWNRELKADLFRLNAATAGVWAQYVAKELQAEIDDALMGDYLEENARIAAEEINATTRAQVAKAIEDPEQGLGLVDVIAHVFEIAVTVRALEISWAKVTNAANFGSQEGARQGGLKTKTWNVNSGNPRDAHAVMDGETVGIGDLFSNGMRWPGDPAGGAENNAHCQCSVSFGR